MFSMREDRGTQWKRDMRKRLPGAASLLRAALIGAAMALVWGVLSHLLQLEIRFPSPAAKQLFDQPLSVRLALYGFAGPVLEELLFRKLLYDLVRKVAPGGLAAVIVSALFALWHGNILQMLYAFPAGLILQALRASSGRMEESILCHISANLTAIVVTAMPGSPG